MEFDSDILEQFFIEVIEDYRKKFRNRRRRGGFPAGRRNWRMRWIKR